jgi:hypothetical protein
MLEHDQQNLIRFALSQHGTFFRANAGMGWQGKIIKHTGSDLVLRNPRPFHGLPEGFSDLFGVVPVIITPAMVGQLVGMFGALEIKVPGKKPTPEQENFLAVMRGQGAITGWARTPEEAVAIVTGSR